MAPDKKLVHEWIKKADGDYEAALYLFKDRKKKTINYIIAFHYQQAIEKYLKALLIGHKTSFPKIHDLVKLLSLITPRDQFLAGIREDLSALNPYAIDFRYPGDDLENDETKSIINITKRLRKILLGRLKEFVRLK